MNILINNKQLSDKVSMCLSICCILHCIALPLLILIIPNLDSFWIYDENVHIVLVFFAIPISLFAVAKSFRKHKSYKCISLAVTGLLLLVFAISMHNIGFHSEYGHSDKAHHTYEEHNDLGEILEMTLTVLGGLVLFTAHFFNIKLSNKPT